MTQYRGMIRGNHGPATRCGTKKSGLSIRAGSWSGGVVVSFYHDHRAGVDMVHVSLCQWENGAGSDRLLYQGPADGTGMGAPARTAKAVGATLLDAARKLLATRDDEEVWAAYRPELDALEAAIATHEGREE